MATLTAAPSQALLRPAGFWIRVWASILDSLILTGITFPIGFFFGLAIVSSGGDADSVGANVFSYLIGTITSILYSGILVAQNGATFGKRICKIKIVRDDGTKLTTGMAFGRPFLVGLSGIILGLGHLFVAIRSDKRAMHDLMMGTKVIYTSEV